MYAKVLEKTHADFNCCFLDLHSPARENGPSSLDTVEHLLFYSVCFLKRTILTRVRYNAFLTCLFWMTKCVSYFSDIYWQWFFFLLRTACSIHLSIYFIGFLSYLILSVLHRFYILIFCQMNTSLWSLAVQSPFSAIWTLKLIFLFL